MDGKEREEIIAFILGADDRRSDMDSIVRTQYEIASHKIIAEFQPVSSKRVCFSSEVIALMHEKSDEELLKIYDEVEESENEYKREALEEVQGFR